MIDWTSTQSKFGYSSVNELTSYRPKVVCNCDSCGKVRIITIRVKSRIINNDLPWLCPSCVGKSLSDTISERMRNKWSNNKYRLRQIFVKRTEDYRNKASISSIQRWRNPKYRSQFKPMPNSEFHEKHLNDPRFDYSNTIFKSWDEKLKIKCQICNECFEIKPLNHISNRSCPNCVSTTAEFEIKSYINSIGFDVISHDRSLIKPFEIDIFVPEFKLGIEYHGAYWHSYDRSEVKKEKLKHQNKALMAIQNGINLKQFYCFEWNNNKDLIKSMLDCYCGNNVKLNARDCNFLVVSNEDVKDFLDQNHLQGHRNASICVGLFYDNQLVSVATFSKKDDGYELIRLASKRGLTIMGGPSKLITNSFKIFKFPKLYTFADLRYSSANVYNKLGFNKLYVTSPNYKYIKNKIILSRQQCQKHKLIELLGNKFDPNLTESQNMFNSGFRRLWDAGNIKLVKYA